MCSKGIRVFANTSSSDIFFSRPQAEVYQYNPMNMTSQKKDFNRSKPLPKFTKAKFLNATTEFELVVENPHISIDTYVVKKMLNKQGINSFNMKNTSNGILPQNSSHKITFTTAEIEQCQTYRLNKVKSDFKGMGMNLNQTSCSFHKQKNDIIPSDATYMDVGVSTHLKRSSSALSYRGKHNFAKVPSNRRNNKAGK